MSTPVAAPKEPKSSGTPAPDAPETKKEGESKNGLFEIPKAAGRFAKELFLNLWDGIKFTAGTIKDSVVGMYRREKALYDAMGGLQYALQRIGKIGFKLIKLALAVLVVQVIMQFAGLSLFDPMTLLVIAGIAIVAVAACSYLAQKKMGEVSYKQIGANVFQEALAS